jgi:hypothetical protein
MISGRDCAKALEKAGFISVRRKGSHMILMNADFVGFQMSQSFFGWKTGGMLTRDYWENWYIRARNALFGPPVAYQGSLEAEASPIYSFLHRVDNERLPEYFQSRWEGRFGKEDVPSFREMAEAYPGDPYIQMHAIEVEAAIGDLAKAESLLAARRTRLETAPDVELRETAKRVFHKVLEAQGLPVGKDFTGILRRLLDEQTNMGERLETMASLLKTETLLKSGKPVVEPILTSAYPNWNSIKFLDAQLFARVGVALADLDLFQGKRSESLEKTASIYRLGQTLNRDGIVIERIMGFAIRLIAGSRLENFILNACENENSMQMAWRMLNFLDSPSVKEEGGKITDGEWAVLLARMDMEHTDQFTGVPNVYEIAEVRNLVADTQFSLCRMALAAENRKLEAGAFPKSASEFAPLLPHGLPRDDFSERSLQFREAENGDYKLYSFGPDRKDDLGELLYHPTNGTYTSGDLVLSIPPERKFSFPADGVHTPSAQELLRQFPKGFPIDPFAGDGRTPLSIVDSATDSPVIVFSFGPAGDTPESYSNLTTYKMPGEILINPKIYRGDGIQYVFSPGAGGTPFTLGPYYDPTNGTKSQGQLFIELPR